MKKSENLGNDFSSLLTQVFILGVKGDEIPAIIFDQLYQLEQQGANVKFHLKAMQKGVIYAKYCDHTSLMRRGASEISSFLRKKTEVKLKSSVPKEKTRKGWRSQDSFIGYYFMELNSELTANLVREAGK